MTAAPSLPSLEQLSSLVERVTFHNADSGFQSRGNLSLHVKVFLQFLENRVGQNLSDRRM